LHIYYKLSSSSWFLKSDLVLLQVAWPSRRFDNYTSEGKLTAYANMINDVEGCA